MLFQGAESPSNSVAWAEATSVSSGILIHPAIWRQQTWADNWGSMPLWGELGPHLTQCGQAETYLHAKFHLDPSNHLATVYQRYRQRDRQQSDSIGQTILLTVTQ